MPVKNTIKAIALASFDTNSSDGTYKLVNTGGTTQACFWLRLVNNSNKDITVSYDGTNDHDFVPAGKEFNLMGQTNAQPSNFVANIPLGFKVYIKNVQGTGLFYLSGYYQPIGGQI